MYKFTTILGILFILTPTALGYSDNIAAYLTSTIIGVGVTLVSLLEWANEGKEKWEYWAIAIAGLFAIISPFLFNFAGSNNALVLSVIYGFIFLAAAGYKLFYKKPAYA